MTDLTLHSAHNRIELYTWGDDQCCLPKGAVRATLNNAGEPAGPRSESRRGAGPRDLAGVRRGAQPEPGRAARSQASPGGAPDQRPSQLRSAHQDGRGRHRLVRRRRADVSALHLGTGVGGPAVDRARQHRAGRPRAQRARGAAAGVVGRGEPALHPEPPTGTDDLPGAGSGRQPEHESRRSDGAGGERAPAGIPRRPPSRRSCCSPFRATPRSNRSASPIRSRERLLDAGERSAGGGALHPELRRRDAERRHRAASFRRRHAGADAHRAAVRLLPRRQRQRRQHRRRQPRSHRVALRRHRRRMERAAGRRGDRSGAARSRFS